MKLAKRSISVLMGIGVLVTTSVGANEEQQKLETLIVTGKALNLIGESVSASEGVVGQQDIEIRPLLRTGEVLELVPGMVVTQHSGTGKANQYFLRGFNLDHGTDFSTSIDFMPLNMRTHGHGQGYTDMNPVIPELVERINYQKGAYYAHVGDFSGAGGAQISTFSRLPEGRVELTLGEDDFARLVALDSFSMGGGDLVAALELNGYDGPWSDINEDMRKYNLMLKHTRTFREGDLSINLMSYGNDWKSADQIPSRAVAQKLISALGSLDDSLGGDSSRTSISVSWRTDALQLASYAVRYDLSLWSNFTYFLDDPNMGDQFQQVDERWIYGAHGEFRDEFVVGGSTLPYRFGIDVRLDDIAEVALYRSRERVRHGAVRRDAAEELSVGVFADVDIPLSDSLTAVLGLRHDYFDFEVQPLTLLNVNGIDLSQNQGRASESIWSGKASLSYKVNDQSELYAAVGQGFHSNDARGVVSRVDPSDGENIQPVDPLVRSFGYEAGLRMSWQEKLNVSMAAWSLDLDSELLFVGDAGTTEESRKSNRYGVELTAYYRFNQAFTFDMEYAWTHARFADTNTDGRYIPGAVRDVLQAGVSFSSNAGWFGALRGRYFGGRPLIEDNSVRSDSSFLVNARLGREMGDWVVKADLLNLVDSSDHDITYLYSSRLEGEPLDGIEDTHFHVLEPRTLRLSISHSF